jgi:hypothetical protein
MSFIFTLAMVYSYADDPVNQLAVDNLYSQAPVAPPKGTKILVFEFCFAVYVIVIAIIYYYHLVFNYTIK